MNSLDGEIAIVTGASRGIGHAIAIELAEAGAAVIINYRKSKEDAESLVAQIRGKGGRASAFCADVSQEQEVQNLVSFTMNEFKRIDILVCNAGSTRDQLIAAMKLEDWDTVIQNNLRSVFLCIRAVVPYMMGQKYGSIINMSSIAAEHGSKGHCNYTAAKGGVNAITRALAVELARKGIRVNAVSPGVILTDMSQRIRNFADKEIIQQIPMRRFGNPQEVAKAVRFLASKDASYITGEVLNVTGGLGV